MVSKHSILHPGERFLRKPQYGSQAERSIGSVPKLETGRTRSCVQRAVPPPDTRAADRSAMCATEIIRIFILTAHGCACACTANRAHCHSHPAYATRSRLGPTPESAAETRNALTWAVIVRIHALASWSGSGEVASHSQGPSASTPRKFGGRLTKLQSRSGQCPQ